MPEEYDAVCSKLSSLKRWPADEKYRNIYAWQIGKIYSPAQRSAYSVVIGMTGRAGTNESTSATLEAIQLWNPRYIFFVGIAGGLSNVKKGDIIIADIVHGYEYGKIGDKGFSPRRNWTYPTDHGLFTGATAYTSKADWRKYIQREPPEACESKAFFGEVASGDKVVDNPDDDFFKQVKIAYPKVVAVEMEGAGIGVAIEKAYAHGRTIGFLMIRGISDIPRQKSSEEETQEAEERDNWKLYASDVVAAFTLGYISDGLPMPSKVDLEQAIHNDLEHPDILVNRNITRLEKEMDELIAPLYSKLGDEFYFDCHPIVLGKDRPEGIDPMTFLSAHAFWSEIKKKLHLTPKTIRKNIEDFIELKLGNRPLVESNNEICKKWLQDLTESVRIRYMEPCVFG